MSNGRLIPPNLDDRTWQDIVDEAKALIPKYAPEWTDHNPSDLGIALIELFAWIVEGMIYRLNKVPDKNYIEFLNLIGITRDPATPARTTLSFTVSAPGRIDVPVGTQVATPQTETEESMVFETDEDLHSLTQLIIPEKTAFPIPYRKATADLVSGPLQDVEITIPTSIQGGIILGFNRRTCQYLDISFRFTRPAPEGIVELSMYCNTLAGWAGLTNVPIINDETESFVRDGKVSLQLPINWKSLKLDEIYAPGVFLPTSPADEVKDSLFWLWIVIGNLSGAPLNLTINSVAVNSVFATNALTVNMQQDDAQAELLGVSTEKPFQIFTLSNTPLYKKPGVEDSYEHLKIQVREPIGGGAFGPWEDWTRVEDIGKGNGQEYRCNPVTGEIMFGNYEPATGEGNGHIPKQDSEIRALTYRYVAGDSKGNVSANTITVPRTPMPSGFVSVTNPAAATGGSNQERIEETKRRAPEILRNRYRAVTAEDYEYLAREATTDIKIVRCLEPRVHENEELSKPWQKGEPWYFGGLDRSPGNVNLIIVPDEGMGNPRPEPSIELIKEVITYLDKRRDLTARLRVTGPRYLPIKTVVRARVWEKATTQGYINDPSEIETEIENKILKFFHPIHGGSNGEGWQVGQHVLVSDLYNAIKPLDHIGYIATITVEPETPIYHFPPLGLGGSWQDAERPFDLTPAGATVRVVDYELVCFGSSDVRASETV